MMLSKRVKIKAIKEDAKWIGEAVFIKGWARTLRNQKNFTFIELNDGSSLSNLQIIVDHSLPDYETLIAQITTGTSLAVKGTIVKSPGDKQSVEIHATHLTLYGSCDAERYPLQKKRHSFEYLRTIAHLRPRTNTLGAVMRVRNSLAASTHRFFQELGFLYVHTPLITTLDCEGGGKMFQVTTLEPDHPPKNDNGDIDYSQDFFGKKAFLTVSGQLNIESYACSLCDVYSFGPTFRAENSNTSRHLAEFWMIEPEMAFADIHDNMDLAESYLKRVFSDILNENSEDMALFDQFIQKGIVDNLKKIVDQPFERITYTQAIEILEQSHKPFAFPVHWGCDLQSEHERYLCEEHFKKPVIVRNYPAAIKAFYMRTNEDLKTVAAMDVLLPGIGEIIGGSQREERYDQLVEKMDALELDKKDYWWYLELRQYGSVPHSGFGVGFERLVQFVTGMDNIRDVIPFPRFPGHSDF